MDVLLVSYFLFLGIDERGDLSTGKKIVSLMRKDCVTSQKSSCERGYEVQAERNPGGQNQPSLLRTLYHCFILFFPFVKEQRGMSPT